MNDLPAGWDKLRLGDVAVRTSHVDPSRSPDERFELYSVPSFSIGEPDRLRGEEIKSSKQAVEPDDVLLCKIVPHINRVWTVAARSAQRQIASGEWIVYRTRHSDPQYLRHCLSEASFREQFMATVAGVGGSLMRARPSEVAKIEILLAPLREQRRIVAKIGRLSAQSKRARDELDHVPRLVEKYKQAILAAAFRSDLTRDWRKDHHQPVSTEQLEALRRSAWQSVRDRGRVTGHYSPAKGIDWRPDIDLPSNWICTSLDQIACLIQYGTSAKATEDQQGIAVLRMGNIQDGKLDLSSLKFLPEDHDEFPDLLLESGDVLFNRTNSAELVGKSAVYFGQPEKASFASYLIRVRCSGLLPKLLSGYINSAYGREWVASVVSQQVGQANVNGTKLRQLGVPVMPPDEQQEIIHRVRTAFGWIDRLASETINARKLVDHLDQAILAKAFRGELVPQDPNDEPASVLLERIRAERAAAPVKVKRRPRQVQTRTRRGTGTSRNSLKRKHK
jgi:type I restriction enzyme, S subunit